MTWQPLIRSGVPFPAAELQKSEDRIFMCLCGTFFYYQSRSLSGSPKRARCFPTRLTHVAFFSVYSRLV